MKKILSLALSCLFVITLLGCNGVDNNIESINDLPSGIPEYNEDTGRFFIYGFGEPRALSIDNWQTIKDCNMDAIIIDPWYNSTNINSEENIEKALELCEKVGIKGYIMPNNSHEELDESKYISFEDYKVDYSSYSAFGGFYAFDEPNTTQFDWILNDYNKFKIKYPNYDYMVTLMRIDTGGPCNNAEEYWSTYGEKILTQMDKQKRYVAYDNYPLEYSNKLNYNLLRTDILKYYDIVAYYAKKYETKVYNYLQTLGYAYGRNRMPSTVEDIRWQVAYSLAFGTSGFGCFTYSTYNNPGFDTSMITPSGDKTDVWYFCQQVFNELRQFEKTYFAFDYQGTMVVDTDASSKNPDEVAKVKLCKIDNHNRVKSLSAERDLLVGVFKDKNGYDGFLFNSFNDPYYMKTNKIHVEFNNATKAKINLNGTESIVNLEKGVFDWTVKAGDILFVIPIV